MQRSNHTVNAQSWTNHHSFVKFFFKWSLLYELLRCLHSVLRCSVFRMRVGDWQTGYDSFRSFIFRKRITCKCFFKRFSWLAMSIQEQYKDLCDHWETLILWPFWKQIFSSLIGSNKGGVPLKMILLKRINFLIRLMQMHNTQQIIRQII